MRRLVDSVRSTAAGEVEVVFYIDADDRLSLTLAEQLDVVTVTGPRIVLSDMWNTCAEEASFDILMQCGDDIVFRTPGWDHQIAAAFADLSDGIGLVYGNDLAHGSRLATHPFLHRRWVEVVGYFLPPGFSCDWSDMWLYEVAGAIGRRTYLPQVITEHLHPAVGKARLDDTHRERLRRGRRDDVAALYRSRAPERARDIAVLLAAMEAPRE